MSLGSHSLNSVQGTQIIKIENIVSSSKNYKTTIKEAGELFFNNNKVSFFDIMAVKVISLDCSQTAVKCSHLMVYIIK